MPPFSSRPYTIPFFDLEAPVPYPLRTGPPDPGGLVVRSVLFPLIPLSHNAFFSSLYKAGYVLLMTVSIPSLPREVSSLSV